MSTGGPGLMLIVDASCLFETLTRGVSAGPVDERMKADAEQVAPHIIDVEVFGAVRGAWQRGRIDRSEARQAVEDLQSWPGERFGHRLLLPRAWELRDTVRGWDAMYVALAEALDGTLLTTDRRLAKAPGPRCEIEVISG